MPLSDSDSRTSRRRRSEPQRYCVATSAAPSELGDDRLLGPPDRVADDDPQLRLVVVDLDVEDVDQVAQPLLEVALDGELELAASASLLGAKTSSSSPLPNVGRLTRSPGR